MPSAQKSFDDILAGYTPEQRATLEKLRDDPCGRT